MADTLIDTPTGMTAGLTDEALLEERQRFWSGFTRFATFAAAGVALLLILLAIFLV